MGGVKLKTVEEEKDIGGTIHNSLKPSRHCKKVADTANAVLRQLTKISIFGTAGFSKNCIYNT